VTRFHSQEATTNLDTLWLVFADFNPKTLIDTSFDQSASQNNVMYPCTQWRQNTEPIFSMKNAPQGSPRADEVPTVQTKAKMNHMLSRGSATEFGMDSMFQSTRNDSVVRVIFE
jgi:hypothetical protein